MSSLFQGASIDALPHKVNEDRSALEQVLSREAFAEAHAAITAWPGYSPTPLHSLPALSQHCGVAAIHYKDEGPRFDLGSFKALGGAYATQQLLQREL